LVPRIAQIVMNTSFRMFPDSRRPRATRRPSRSSVAEAIAMQQMMRGIHF
jgi:hypothetical protein